MPSETARPPQLHFFGCDPQAFDRAVAEWGWPRFRGKQVRDWVYTKLVADPLAMTNLPQRDREELRARVQFAAADITRHQSSADGTQKLLLTWDPDGRAAPAAPQPDPDVPAPETPPADAPRLPLIPPSPAAAPARPAASAETVMIPDADRRTACVSSQVGCPVGCRFCASGLNGVKGNLTAAQIVEQVFQLNQLLKDDGGRTNADEPARKPSSSSFVPHPSSLRLPRITNVVFMGMGEPLANYNNVMAAIRLLHHPECFNLGARRITISTVGVPSRIRDLAREELPLNLALSLHAPNEKLRRQLIPWAEHFELDDILDACRFYFDRTGREVTLEYILLSGVNDRPEHARQLAQLCHALRSNVNLIRYNEVEGLPYARPKADDVMTFQNVLRHNGVNAHVRKSRGRDIDAACGQLRRKQEEQGRSDQLVSLGATGD